MISYEFVQPSEFEDPYYEIIDDEDGEIIGTIFFGNLAWHGRLDGEFGFCDDIFISIGMKIKQLNNSNEQQLFLGVF